MSNVGRYVMRMLADRIEQPGKWHIVRIDRNDSVITKCGTMMRGRRHNVRWIGWQQTQGADHTLAFSDFPRDARTQDRDDTNVCSRCAA